MNDGLVTTATTTDDVLVVAVRGELDLATETELVNAFTAHVTAHSKDQVVLDLSEVSFIDSSGLRALLLCRRSATEHSKTLRLCKGSGHVAKLLRISGVETAFDYT